MLLLLYELLSFVGFNKYLIKLNVFLLCHNVFYIEIPKRYYLNAIHSHFIVFSASSMSLYHKPIEDNEEVPEEELSSEDEVDTGLSVRKRKRKSTNTGGFADEFQFDDYDESSAVDNFEGIKHYLKNTVASTLQEKIDEERSKQNIDKRVSLFNVSSETNISLGCSWWRN